MKKIHILFIAVLGLIILSVFFYGKNQNFGATIPKTSGITDKSLTQFYLWTQEDPLFTAPNFDLKAFSDAILNLEATEAIYMKQFKLTYKIYPDNFLNDLISVNKAHNDFINNKTAVNAKNLITIYKTTVKDYKSGVENLKLSTKDLVSKGVNVDYDTIYLQGINTITTLKTFYDDLEKIKSNVGVLEQEISKRQGCLENGMGCQRPVDDFSNFKIINKTYNFNKNDILPKDLLFYGRMLPSWTWQGPYIVSTQCFGWSDVLKEKPYLFYIINIKDKFTLTDTPKEHTIIVPKIATDRYYRELDVNEKKVYGERYKRIAQGEGNDYMCPSQEYKSKLNSINYLFTSYKNKQIFSALLKLPGISGEVGRFFIEGQVLEKKFFNAEFPSETDADNLVNYYGLLYQKILIWTEKPNYTKESWLVSLFNQKTEILNLYLGYKRGLFNIDKQIIRLAWGLNSMRMHALFWEKERVNTRPQVYTYMIRSDWGLLYFPFSKSFYRYEKPMDYIVKAKVNNVGFDKQYITYWEALKHYSLEEIKSWYITVRSAGVSKKYIDYLESFPDINR